MAKAKDLTNCLFDKLTVLKKVGINKLGYSLWLCECECGKEIIRSRHYLISKQNKVKSCGCIYYHKIKKKEDNLVDKRFGKLTVLRHDDKIDENYSHYWLCKCDCGKEKILMGNELKRGGVTNCGSYKCSFEKEPGETGFNKLLRSYKFNAKEKNLKFMLSVEEFRNLVMGDCSYCGSKPSTKIKVKSEYSIFTFNGIDRIDNSRGYVPGNVLTCCKKCNMMKFSYTRKEFINHCILIDTFQKSKEEKINS